MCENRCLWAYMERVVERNLETVSKFIIKKHFCIDFFQQKNSIFF
jgi:hypothetical protein